MNDAHVKVESNTNPANTNVAFDDKRGFEMPFLELLRASMPSVFRGISEQSVVQLKESCERMKVASGRMADALRETCTTNAKGAADYGARVIEISSVNTGSALDFLTSLAGAQSPADIMRLSFSQARKNLDLASAQNKELWDLAQKVAIEAAEPLQKSVAGALQRAG